VLPGARRLLEELSRRARAVVLSSSAKPEEADHYIRLLDARELLDDLRGREVVILGTGETSELTAKALADSGVRTVFVATRRRDRALGLARRYGGASVNFDELPQALERADIVVAATGDDEDNRVICQFAKERVKVNRVIARINNPRTEEVFHRPGLEQTVNGTADWAGKW